MDFIGVCTITFLSFFLSLTSIWRFLSPAWVSPSSLFFSPLSYSTCPLFNVRGWIFLSFYYHGLSQYSYSYSTCRLFNVQGGDNSLVILNSTFFYFHSLFACFKFHFFLSLFTHLFSLDIFNVRGGIFVLIFQSFNSSISIFCCCPKSIILPWPFTVFVFIFNLPSL